MSVKQSLIQILHAYVYTSSDDTFLKRSDFDGYVRLDDFFDGEISKGRPSIEIAPKIRRVKGLSITVSEGFIDEKKWWRKIFRSRPEDAISM